MAEDQGTLPKPLPGGPDPEPPTETLAPNPLAGTAGDDQASLDNSYNRTVRSLREQPLVRIRIPKEGGPQTVRINGWFASYAAGEVHMVPAQVAEILEEGQRI